MPVGRPISLTPNVATQSFTVTATAGQTSFTVTNGYRLNELGVYRNGVRLIQGKDFTASDGSTVTLLSGAVLDDVIEFQIFDSFNIADALVSYGNQSISGNLTATAFIGDGSSITGVAATDNINTNNIKVSGISTLGTETTVVGSAVTFDASGGTIVGVLTATSFSGDGTNLGGIAGVGVTARIDSASLTVSGIATCNGVLDANAEVTAAGGVDITGGLKVGAASTLQVLTATTGTFSGAVNIDDTTSSTSTSTGALIVDGGVGIAGSLHVGENVSVGGTLTYEDVTNIDSVGVVTARTGIKVLANGIDVVGVGTFSGGVDIPDNKKITFGDSSDFSIQHNTNENYIQSDSGHIYIRANVDDDEGDNIYIQPKSGENSAIFTHDGSVELYNDNVKKFSTRSDGAEIHAIEGGEAILYFTADEGDDATDKYRIVAQDGGDLVIQRYTGSAYSSELRVGSTSGVQANYQGSAKLNTTPTGVVVTGMTTSTTGIHAGPGILRENFRGYGSAMNGAYNADVLSTGMVLNAPTNSTATFSINVRGNGSTTFNSLFNAGESAVFTAFVGQNNASYYLTDFQIDGSSITEEWAGGTAPSAGGSSGTDVYTFTILKTADATFSVFANLTNFA